MKKVFLFFIVVLFHFSAKAEHALCGKVLVNDEVQANTLVMLLGEDDSTYTDKNGHFCFDGLSPKVYYIMAEYDYFISPMEKVEVAQNVTGVVMKIDILSTDTVSIAALSAADRRRSISIKTEVVDLSKQALSSISVEQLMNRATGIRVRNSGGLGAEADIVVGGFTGKSIKFLIDGIPLDYLGSSMGITKIPSNMADYVEVYKGVLPTEIGADALGAAVNIVTRNPTKTGHRISYDVGSFNTHKVVVNSFVRLSKKLSFGVNAFYNYSKNNFKVDQLPIEDKTTGRTLYVKAPLFHNAYQQYSGDAYVNIEHRKWVDLLQIKFNAYAIDKEIQNDFSSRDKAYGAVYRKEHAYLVPSVLYKKNFLDNKLKLSQFLVFSSINFQFADTLRNAHFDWYGKKHRATSGSETGNNFSNLEEPIIKTRINNFTYRGLFTYSFNDNHQLILNVIENYLSRESDDLNRYRSKTTINYNRIIAGLGYKYLFLDSRLQALSQVKYLSSQTKGELLDVTTNRMEKAVQNSGWSFSQSLKYHSYTGWLLRASVENSYRLPDQMEIFGDNVHVLPSISLKPERSFNVNAGVRYQDRDLLSIEINLYYRNVKDMIKLKEISQLQAAYINLDNVRGYGFELEGAVYPVKGLELSGNLTYNDFRFKGSNSNLSKNEHFVNARVSNMPFYFGNANISYGLDDFFSSKSKLKMYWTYTYVHQFYLDYIEKQYEPDGILGLFGQSKVNTNRVIPVQQVHSSGLVWSYDLPKSRKIAVSGELNNIFDQSIFNNFKMQSAGRNYSVKMTVEI